MGKKIKVQNACHGKKFSAQTNAPRTTNDSIKSSHSYWQTLMLSFAFLHGLTKTLNFFPYVIFLTFLNFWDFMYDFVSKILPQFNYLFIETQTTQYVAL